MNLMPSKVQRISEVSAREILHRISCIALISNIGATSKEIGSFYNVSIRTIQRIYLNNREEFLKYGDYIQSKEKIKQLVDDKFVACKTRKLNLFNRI